VGVCFRDDLVTEITFHVYCTFSYQADFSSNFDAFTNGKTVKFTFCIKYFTAKPNGASSYITVPRD